MNSPLVPQVKLCEVARVQSGAGFPDRFQGGRNLQFPLYKVSDMNLAGNEIEMISETNSISDETRQELGAVVFPLGSVIFPKVGGAIATNKKRLIVKPACVDNNVMGVIPIPTKINSRLLFYFFQAHDLTEFANNAGLPSITKTTVENWVLGTVPPLIEQQRIVGILDKAFDGVATAKANAEKNLRNAHTLFESYLQFVFSRDASQCEQKALLDLCDGSRGITYGVIKLGDESLGGVPCLRTSNVRWLRIEQEGMKRIAPSLSSEYSRTILRGGEVLVNVRGSLGGVAVVPPEMSGWNISREVAVVPVDPRKVDATYLSYFIGSGVSQQWLGGVKKGAAYVGINLEDLRLLPVSVPALPKQLEIVNCLKRLQTEAESLAAIYHRKLGSLDALKKSLLHQAFSGQL